jgi:tetratricopeptide (TPR) repeat protein
MTTFRILLAGLAATAIALPATVHTQQPPAEPQGQRRAPNPRADSLRQAQRLDAEGKHAEARAIFQRLIDNAPDPAAKAAATRRLAMSYGYDGNCAKVIELEEQVIAYWVTRREAEPQDAHYQEGEMANEAARVCHDNGFLDEAERMYRRGSELGNREPEPRTHPRSLWDYRLAHALARINARRGNAAEAHRWVAEARKALDSDPRMAEDQERFYPYLVGYVALYTGDLATAERELTRASELMRNDPFQVVLLGQTYEKMGNEAKAREMYERAFEMSSGSNPPNVYSRKYTREKLGKR